ncbi:MAG: hypothetical protein WC748_04675 [Legionellales bacterium]|jgi:quercetin dioxygenase-like cupin family protein
MSTISIAELYTGKDQQSHFRTIVINTNSQQPLGLYSKQFPTQHMMFRHFDAGIVFDWHVAPQAQYIIYLEGEVEVEIGCGEKRRFKASDILFANDLSGQGHITRTLTQGKAVIIIT